jgi:hypothetical protein
MSDHPIVRLLKAATSQPHTPEPPTQQPEPKFSLFDTARKVTPRNHLTLSQFMEGVKKGRWRAEVKACRETLKEIGVRAYKASRANVPVVSLSAMVKHRRKNTTPEEKCAVHSGLLQLDFDPKDHPGMTPDQIKKIVWDAPFVFGCCLSLSGDGVKGFARCPASFELHLGSWLAAEAYFKARGLTLDPSTKDPIRLCYVTFDPEALFWDEATEIEPLHVPEKSTIGSASEGTEDPEHVHRVLARLAEKIGPDQDRNTWIHICACTKDAVGAGAAGEIMDEYFPPLEPHHESAGDVMDSLTGTWLSLRKYGIDPVDHLKDLPDLPDAEEGQTKPAPKRLAEFLVNHSDTLGMSWQEIDALRPPFVIDGFLRQGELLLLGAESKSRKSWLTQDAGFSVAIGSPWLADPDGANGFPTRKARVHVLDLELSPSEMRYRFAKARGNRLAESPADAAEMTAQIAAYSLDGLNVSEIRPILAELKSTVVTGDLVIVDCLYRLCPDGNEVREVAEILETLKRFASDTQAGLILVDHFRKAGDEKARNRFAGSFVKQASASTLVAIEVTADDVLVLTIDARTFHGCPKLHARFNPETYAFNRLPEIEVEKAKQASRRGEAEGWILRLWSGRATDSAVTAADAAERWEIRRQGAVPRLEKLVSRGWLIADKSGAGRATKWTLAPDGVAVVKPDREDI